MATNTIDGLQDAAAATIDDSTPRPNLCILLTYLTRLIVVLGLVAWTAYIIQGEIKETLTETQDTYSSNSTAFVDIEFTTNNITVSCKKFNEIDPDYCELPLIKFPSYFAEEIQFYPDTSGCSVEAHSNTSLAAHPTENWRLITTSYGYASYVAYDFAYTSCNFYCYIASESACVWWDPNRDGGSISPDDVWLNYSAVDAVPYWPIEFIPEQYADAFSTTHWACHYLSPMDVYFDNNPLCIYPYPNGTQMDCDGRGENGLGFDVRMFKCAIDPYDGYEEYFGSAGEVAEVQIEDNAEDFYATCEACPKPIIASVVGFFNEYLIAYVLSLFSSSRGQKSSTENSVKKRVMQELKLWWKFLAIARAVIGAFAEVYVILRAIRFGGWLGYLCLVHIALNSSALRIIFVWFIFDAQSGKYEQQPSKWQRWVIFAGDLPVFLIALFYGGMVTCTSFTHVVPFMAVYIWIMLGICIFFGLLRVLNKHTGWVTMMFENMTVSDDDDDDDVQPMPFIVKVLLSLIGIAFISVFYGMLIWIAEVMTAFYLKFGYADSLTVPLGRPIASWLECSVSGTWLEIIVGFMVHLV